MVMTVSHVSAGTPVSVRLSSCRGGGAPAAELRPPTPGGGCSRQLEGGCAFQRPGGLPKPSGPASDWHAIFKANNSQTQIEFLKISFFFFALELVHRRTVSTTMGPSECLSPPEPQGPGHARSCDSPTGHAAPLRPVKGPTEQPREAARGPFRKNSLFAETK